MRVLLGDRWTGGWLDPHRDPQEHRIRVRAWIRVRPVDGLFFVRERSLRTVWNYLREIGPRATLGKVRSRSAERFRNDRWIACGLGSLLEPGEGSGWLAGQPVLFVAPRHPSCVDQLVLPPLLVRAAPASAGFEPIAAGCSLLFLDDREGGSGDSRAAWDSLAGWDPETGAAPLPGVVEAVLEDAERRVRAARGRAGRELPVDPPAAVVVPRERTAPAPAPAESRPAGGAVKTAVLFGFGNYAKTVLLPHLPPGLRVERIHEIDPTQIPRDPPATPAWDTSPRLRPDEHWDAAFIAGYHHTHAPIAVEALARGTAAVVEKPLATTEPQLETLLAALRGPGRRLFAGFHKRYSVANQQAVEDLGVEPGGAISYHCIVYEVPLPERHWYRWPSSRSRLVSNGCHWIDHFLFLNDFATPRRATLAAARDGTISCHVELENDAVFTMTLTDRGSDRLGVRDHVELRARGVTVTIDDGGRYRSENGSRVIRSRRENKLEAYRRMYATIGERILAGQPGDTLRSVEVSTRLVLSLERLLLAETRGGSGSETPASSRRSAPWIGGLGSA